MKRWVPNMIAAVFVLASGTAWAQQQDDLDVTMRVLPANASAGSAMSEMKLPDAASDRARDASAAFGQSTATKAHDMKGDLGRDFGQSVSEAARAKNALESNKGGKGKAP